MKKFRYFATFISGFQELVKVILKDNLNDCHVDLLLDGAVVFETDYSYDRLGLHCFNNIFALIDLFKSKSSSIDSHMQFIMRQKLTSPIISNNSKKIKTFRIITSSENKLVSVNNNIKISFERFLAQQSKLLLNRSKSDTEFWFLYRNEGYGFFMKRLSKHTAYDKLLNKGELHPELAYLLNYIASPSKTDICLDPFCGYGSIPLQRLKHFPTEKFYAYDNNDKVLGVARARLKKHMGNKCVIANIDFNSIENNIISSSIDKIITDPPWGLFENIKNITEFYKEMMNKFIELIKATGKIIILTAQKEDLINSVESIPNCSIINTFNILVSGNRAGVFLIERTDG